MNGSSTCPTPTSYIHTHTHSVFVFIAFPKGNTCQDVIHPETSDSHKEETGGAHHIHQTVTTLLSLFLLSLKDSA